MQTTINNDHHVFLIHRLGFFPRTYFCNLADIKSILVNELEKNDEYKIFMFEGIKLKAMTKAKLNTMCKAQSLNPIF